MRSATSSGVTNRRFAQSVPLEHEAVAERAADRVRRHEHPLRARRMRAHRSLQLFDERIHACRAQPIAGGVTRNSPGLSSPVSPCAARRFPSTGLLAYSGEGMGAANEGGSRSGALNPDVAAAPVKVPGHRERGYACGASFGQCLARRERSSKAASLAAGRFSGLASIILWNEVRDVSWHLDPLPEGYGASPCRQHCELRRDAPHGQEVPRSALIGGDPEAVHVRRGSQRTRLELLRCHVAGGPQDL